MTSAREIVYLDTQDYSRIADAVNGRGDAALIPIYERLRQFQREGRFVFCFSYMIAAEVLQFNPQDLAIARRKAVVMEELCAGRAFPMVFWILASEVLAAAKRRGFRPERDMATLERAVFDGHWIRAELPPPEEMFGQADFEKIREEEFLKARGRPPNRAERRLLDRPISIEAARQVVAAAPLYPIIKDTELFNKMADSFRHRRVVEVADQFFRFLAQPTRLVLSHECLHSMGFLNDQISKLKETFFEAYAKLREHFDELRRARSEKMTRAERLKLVRPIMQEHLVSLTRKLKDHLVRYGVPASYFDHASFDGDVVSIPFLKTWNELLTPYYLMVTDDGPGRRVLDPSDVIDLLHSMYMPYCAVWRSDRYFADLVAPVAGRLGCKVVSKLVDLPDVLASLPERSES